MQCKLCNLPNVGSDHEISAVHIKNRELLEFREAKKRFAGNRKGIIVSCNVKSSYTLIQNCVEAKIKISAKPGEEVKFGFTIKNDTNKNNFHIKRVVMVHEELNFKMNSNGLDFSKPEGYLLKPKKDVQNIVVTFKCSHVGQYEMPVVFVFNKDSTESLLIIRELVVFVEGVQMVHEKVTSPYAQKEVTAAKLYQTTIKRRDDDKFKIPKLYKPIYASGLKVKDVSPELQEPTNDIRNVLETGVIENDNYIRFFHNLLWYEETIVRINLKKYNMSNVPLQKFPSVSAVPLFALRVPGLGEKRPSLMLGDIIFVKPHGQDAVMFEGVIKAIEDNIINIAGLHPDFLLSYNQNKTYDIRFFMSRVPLERMHDAVQNVMRSDQMTRIFPKKNKKPKNIPSVREFFNQRVKENDEQRAAVEHILAGSSGTAPYLLHGPPGTGKTITVVETVLQLVKQNPNNRIMVCTDSNMAADHVATVIVSYAKSIMSTDLILRANSQYRVWETMPLSLHPYSNGSSFYSFEPISIAEFMSYKIVITTLSHAAKFGYHLREKKYERHITHLFIDEAAQASEPAALIPVCGLLKSSGTLVLAGDPLQLGPVVISHNVRKIGLGLSLMERLKNTCELYSDQNNDVNYMVMLRNNFRSNPDILDIPNRLFYKGLLNPLAKEDPLSKIDILGERQNSGAVIFHGVLSKEQRMGKSPSYFNRMELEIVQMYISMLTTDHYVDQDDIGVVTPYIRQVYNIRKWMKKEGYDKIEVGTVEAFQGKEKRVVIISTVRANCNLLDYDAKYQLGFLVDDKRFNVALTRAKAKVIVIGNPLCLQKDDKWKQYIDKCKQLGTYIGFNADNINNDTKQTISERITPLLKELKIVKENDNNVKKTK